MRFAVAIGAGITAFGMIMTTTSTNASTATRTLARPQITFEARRRVQSSARIHGVRGRESTIPTCTTQGMNSFVGANNNNTAGGTASAVLGGTNNDECDPNSAIGAGGGNGIGNGGYAYASFIAAGTYNAITNFNGFIGTGESNQVSGADAFVGSGLYNQATAQNSFVGGGGGYGNSYQGNMANARDAFVGAGESNAANGVDSLVVGGNGDVTTGTASVVVGGNANGAGGDFAFVGSGQDNVANGEGSFVGGGGYIYITTGNNTGLTNNSASGEDSFIGGGDENTVASNESFIGSGLSNSIGSGDSYSLITGGYGNVVKSAYGTIDGGESNTAGGNFATIPGGAHNKAMGILSFAAGYQADANHNGSFVWSDYVSGASPLADTNVDQFVVRASGGVFVYSSESLASGVKLAAGSGTWASLSDRYAKTAIVPVDDEAILAKVAALPVSTWHYKTEKSVRHVGPMAQDFYAAFGVGEDDRHITSIDEDGVALAAIKALHSENERLQAKLVAVEARLTALESQGGGVRAPERALRR